MQSRRRDQGRASDAQGRARHRTLGLVLAAIALSAGCAEQKFTGPPPSQSTARVAIAEAPSLAATASAPVAVAPAAPPLPGWTEAVRLERWATAATLLDALPADELAKPPMRYVRARTAVELGDGARAMKLLEGLERELPLVAEGVARCRAEAQEIAGDHAGAAAYFGASAKAADLVRAASLLEKGGEPKKARALVDRAAKLAQQKKQGDAEVAARAMRARMDEAAGKKDRALVDLRWLATSAATSPEGKAARDALKRLGKQLTAKEKLAVAASMIEGGGAAEALDLLAEIEGKPGVARADRLHARAMALYKVRDYPAAAKAFVEAAKTHTKREPEELYYAGRALDRAGDGDGALARFREIEKRFAKSFFAERASYAGARLLLQLGRFKEAQAAYKGYLGRHARGTSRDEADYEHALSALSAGDFAVARKAFGRLAKDEKRELAGKLLQLEGLAALRMGDREGAIAIWTGVASTLPLTWPGLASRARLAEASAPLPPLLAKGGDESATPLDIALPPVPSLLASLGLDADAERWLASNEGLASAGYAGRESESLCAMYGTLSRAKRRYRVGSAAVGFPALMRAPAPSQAWAWDCVYPQPYAVEVAALEGEYALPRGLLWSIMRQESAFDPGAVSPVGAQGLMQLMPTTAERIASEIGARYRPDAITAPSDNLRLGAAYIAKLLGTFKGNVALAAAAYNAGPLAVSRWLEPAEDRDADLWVARIPYGETRHYVGRVLGNLARYEWLAGGDAGVSELALALPLDARAPADAY